MAINGHFVQENSPTHLSCGTGFNLSNWWTRFLINITSHRIEYLLTWWSVFVIENYDGKHKTETVSNAWEEQQNTSTQDAACWQNVWANCFSATQLLNQMWEKSQLRPVFTSQESLHIFTNHTMRNWMILSTSNDMEYI